MYMYKHHWLRLHAHDVQWNSLEAVVNQSSDCELNLLIRRDNS